eukprot:414056-Lingulodinium_polyedra.AAC.1
MECMKRAIREPLRRRTVDLTATLRNVCKTLHNDAVAIAVRRRNGSQIERWRTPCKRLFWCSREACACEPLWQ